MKMGLALLALTAAGAATAQERTLDLTVPGNVVTALQAAGYKAKLEINKAGEPFISSGANGSPFTVEFYGCEGLKTCQSIQFSSWYKKQPHFTPALVNEWNSRWRFLKIFIDKDGDLVEHVDMSTVGGVTQANFADMVDWYVQMDARLTTFLREKAPPAAK